METLTTYNDSGMAGELVAELLDLDKYSEDLEDVQKTL